MTTPLPRAVAIRPSHRSLVGPESRVPLTFTVQIPRVFAVPWRRVATAGDARPRMRRIHPSQPGGGTRDDRLDIASSTPLTPPVAVSLPAIPVPVAPTTVAPTTIAPAFVPVEPVTVTVAPVPIRSMPIVPTGTTIVVAITVMVMRQAEAQVVVAPVPDPREVAVGPPAMAAEHVVARRIVDPRRAVGVDRAIHHPVDGRMHDRGGFEDFHRLHHLASRFDDFHRLHHLVPGFGHVGSEGLGRGFGIVDHGDLPDGASGLREQRRTGLQYRHKQVEIECAGEVDRPVDTAIDVFACSGNPHLVPRVVRPFRDAYGSGCPGADDQLGATSTTVGAIGTGSGDQDHLPQVEVGGNERRTFVQQCVHIEVLAPLDVHIVDGYLDADAVLLAVPFRHALGFELRIRALVARTAGQPNSGDYRARRHGQVHAHLLGKLMTQA